MPTPIADFDYNLPKRLIAQEPISPREQARLLVVDRQAGSISHRTVSDLPEFFRSGDVVIVNNTKVFKARLFGCISRPGLPDRQVELFLIRPTDEHTWLAVGKPGKAIRSGGVIRITDTFTFAVLDKHPDGSFLVGSPLSPPTVMDMANRYGHIPLPPYIGREVPLPTYQTSYATVTGSVAAPTAGFHLTTAIRRQLRERGVTIREITLHVGLGTFLPVKSETLEDHHMHGEWVSVTAETASEINRAKAEGRRVIAIGTTSVRTLEGTARKVTNSNYQILKEIPNPNFQSTNNSSFIPPYEGDIDLFITPGFEFRVVEAMLTNFHLPKSTLLVLVSAFAGRDLVLRAYREAIDRNYRFYSFGDAMLIL